MINIFLIANLFLCCSLDSAVMTDSSEIKAQYAYEKQLKYVSDSVLPKVLSIYPFLVTDSVHYVPVCFDRFTDDGDFFKSGYAYHFYSDKDSASLNYNISNPQISFHVLVSDKGSFFLSGFALSNHVNYAFLSVFINSDWIRLQNLREDSSFVKARYFPYGDRCLGDYTYSHAYTRIHNFVDDRKMYDFSCNDTVHVDTLGLTFLGRVIEASRFESLGGEQCLIVNHLSMPSNSSMGVAAQLSYYLYSLKKQKIWEYSTPVDSMCDYIINPTLFSDYNKDSIPEIGSVIYLENKNTRHFVKVFFLFEADSKAYLLSYEDGAIDENQLSQIPAVYRKFVTLKWKQIIHHYFEVRNSDRN